MSARIITQMYFFAMKKTSLITKMAIFLTYLQEIQGVELSNPACALFFDQLRITNG